MPKGIARHLKSSLYGRGIVDSELLLKFIGYFADYLSALPRTLLRFFWTTFVKTAVFPRFRKKSKPDSGLVNFSDYVTVVQTRNRFPVVKINQPSMTSHLTIVESKRLTVLDLLPWIQEVGMETASTSSHQE